MSPRVDPAAQERGARPRKHRRVVRLHSRQRDFSQRDDISPRRARGRDGAAVTNVRIGEFEPGLPVVLLLRHHAIEPDHAWASMRDRGVPYSQPVAAAAQVLAHDVEAEEGEARAVIDAGDGRGRNAVDLADEEARRIGRWKQASSAKPGFQPSAAAQSTAVEISSGRIVRMWRLFVAGDRADGLINEITARKCFRQNRVPFDRGDSATLPKTMRAALLRPRRASDRRPQHRIQQRSAVVPSGSRRKMSVEPSVEQQHGEAVHQRPRAYDRGGLVQRQRLFARSAPGGFCRSHRASPAKGRSAASCSDGRDMSSRSVRNIRPYMPGWACA